MASPEGNYEALKMILADVYKDFGIQPGVPGGQEPMQPFDRIWLPKGDGITASTGVANPTGLACYGQMTRVPGGAYRVECGHAYSLTLDRQWSTPQAIIGVKFSAPPSSRTDCIILTPGDTIQVKSGFDRFWIFAADNLDQFAFPLNGILGYVSFLVGRTVDNTTPLQPECHPTARAVAWSSSANVGVGYVNNGKFKRLRVLACPMNAGAIDATGFSGLITQDAAVRVAFPDASLPTAIAETPDQGQFSQGGLGAQWSAGYTAPRMHTITNIEYGPVTRRWGSAIVDAHVGPIVLMFMSTFYWSTALGGVFPTGFSWLLEAVNDNDAHNDTVYLVKDVGIANTLLTITPVPTADIASIGISITFSAGVITPGVIGLFAIDPITNLPQFLMAVNVVAAQTSAYIAWGDGVQFSTGNPGGLAGPLPHLIRITVPALGAAISVSEILVWGTRKQRQS
jgi:hypothetical protein